MVLPALELGHRSSIISPALELGHRSSIILPIVFTLILHSISANNPRNRALPITCPNRCGSTTVKYPLGIGGGCGHPDFNGYIKCNSGSLQFSTSTGVYTISSIDYISNTLVVTDPLMSNCTSMQNSGSFGLDPSAPFELATNDVFVLLGCSTTSPIFDPNEDLCDTGSHALRVCRGIYSCKGVTGIGLQPNTPISTCCVYDTSAFPRLNFVGSSGYVIDLPKLQCSSYTGIYGYGDDGGDPNKWNYGIALQFNTSYQSSDACRQCEITGGTCGYTGFDQAFACVCRNGVNTTATCYGQGYSWSVAWTHKSMSMMNIHGLLFLTISLFI